MTRAVRRPPFECIALTLQGGGALGAYQAGVYQGLADADLHPDWVAGISIGAINAAIIAGNPPDTRVGRLREFWNSATSEPYSKLFSTICLPSHPDREQRKFVNQISAAAALTTGVSGLFKPRLLPPLLSPSGSLDATSYYDSKPLLRTLERLVDFDRINNGTMRFSAGAVNVETGNFVYFDSTKHKIVPEHIMASAALPPGFPMVEIDGEHYWDGGLVSNTPLQWVLQYGTRQDTLTFEVDLWNARGKSPRNIMEVATRQKEITYSSRTRENIDQFKEMQRVRHAVARLIEEAPERLDGTSDACGFLKSFADRKVYSVVHLIYHTSAYEGNSKDYEFSRASMSDHRRAGYHDTVRALQHPEALARPTNVDGFATYDFADHDT